MSHGHLALSAFKYHQITLTFAKCLAGLHIFRALVD
ncbi:hypothetical protein C357_09587 [Citreicella sp. 357]|nr:hypothetical protein C357_09587 [Citreicella sp. 357]